VKPRDWLFLLLVVASSAIVYLPALHVGFLSDDFAFAPMYSVSWHDLVRILQLVHSGDLTLNPFRPVALGSLWLDYQIWGWQPYGFHLTNILLHSLNAALAYRLFRALKMPDIPALVSALMYGLYPGHPEAVTWITGRFDLLAQAFFLSSLLLWIEGRRRQNGWCMLSSSLLFLPALFSKESIVAGILIFPLVDWFFFSEMLTAKTRQHLIFRFTWLAAQAGMVLVLILTRLWLFGSFIGDAGWTRGLAFPGRTFDNLLNALWLDLLMLFTPLNRLLFNDWAVAAFAILAIALFAGGAYVSVIAAKQKNPEPMKLLVLGLIWTLILPAPTLPLAPVRFTMQCSRYLYAPFLGISIIAGLGFYSFPRVSGYRRWLPILALCLWLAFSIGVLSRQNALWLEAGALARQVDQVVLDNTRDIADGTTIVIVNMPWLWKGVYFAPNGYNGYIEWIYHRHHLSVMYTEKDPSQIDQWWENLSQSRQRYKGFLWDPATRTLVPLPDASPSQGR
jgi:hypothetical protein